MRSLFAAVISSICLSLPVSAQGQYDQRMPAGANAVSGQGQMQINPNQMPVPNQMPGQINRGSRPGTESHLLKGWFDRYDQVRHQAQMSPLERNRADNLLSQGLAVFVPGEEKTAAQKLLRGLVIKYQVAVNDMKQLPLYPETEQLHRGYYQYFSDARALFSDYLRVQDNIMVKDERTGKSLMSELMLRKANLEALEHQVKEIDQALRGQLGIGPYRY
jgi:hypothetical protein